MTINRVNTYQGGTLTVAANLYGNGGGTVWQLTEWRPNCNALIAETAIDGDRAELDALRDELEDLSNGVDDLVDFIVGTGEAQ